MQARNSRTKYRFLLLMLSLVFVFGLWGCNTGDDDGGGGGANFAHDLTITVTNNAGGALPGFTNANVVVNTTSGVVGVITVAGTQVTFTVYGMEVDPTYITMTVDIAGYIPLVRTYRATVAEVFDDSGDGFASALSAYNQIPAGGGVEDSPPVDHDPTGGTSGPIATTTPVDAGDGFTAGGTLPAGTVFTTPTGGTVNDQILMKLTYHQGIGAQETYYPNGSYPTGNTPDAFGTLSFLTSTGDAVIGTAAVDVALALTFGETTAPTATNDDYFVESDRATATETTSACITDVTSGETVTISDCSYDTVTEIYTCANGYYSFPSGTSVGTYRIDGGACPTTTSADY